MARPKSKGAYVPLAVHYFMDDAILEAGPEAELLFVRILSFLASVPSNGFITDRQVRTIVGLGLRNLQRRVSALEAVGLLIATDGGFTVRSWLKWNRSADEVGRLLAKDRERKSRSGVHADDSELHGNYSGVHADDSELHTDAPGHGVSRSEGPHDSGAVAPYSVRNPAGIQQDSALQSSTEQSSTEQTPPKGGGARSRATRIPEPFIVTSSMREWAATEVPGVDVDRSTRTFVDYWRAESGAKATKRDWVATWRNWLRRDAEKLDGRRLTPTERAQQTVAAGRRVAGQRITSLEPKELAS